jgi:holo-[acyl-carrier protein] synthase
MIAGIGIDTIDVTRIEKSITSDPQIKTTIFTKSEITYCETKTNKYLHFSGRFAAKEAFLKAISIGLNEGFKFLEIEVLNKESGQPYLNLYGSAKKIIKEKKITNVLLSLTHDIHYASAIVILEK